MSRKGDKARAAAYVAGQRKLTRGDVAEAARLCAQGWTHARIAARFGVTRQAVSRVLSRLAQPRRARCRDCDANLNPAVAQARDDRHILCLDCLAKLPDATFAEWLRAHRVATGLQVQELERRARLRRGSVSGYEHGGVLPRAGARARLLEALGVAGARGRRTSWPCSAPCRTRTWRSGSGGRSGPW